MTKEMRIRIFLTQYAMLCEKYNLHFEEGLVEGTPNSVSNPLHSTIVLRDDTPNEPDVYFIAGNTKSAAKVYSLDDREHIIEPFNNIPEFDKPHCKTEEEIQAELKALGLM